MNKGMRLSAVLRLAANDFKAKYAGSALGAFWAIAEPIVTAAVYWFVYTIAFHSNWEYDVPYYLWLSVGISAWFFISDGLRGVTASFRDYSYLVKKLTFDKGVLPYVRTLSALISHMIFLILVMIMCAAEGIFPSEPLYTAAWVTAAALYVYSLGGIFALICAKFKDMQNIVGIGLNICFWLTPVFWDLSSAEDGIRRIIMLNPAAAVTEGYRSAVLYGAFSVRSYLYVIAVCVTLIVLGNIMMRFMLPNISDNL